jgi:hypothetical protein
LFLRRNIEEIDAHAALLRRDWLTPGQSATTSANLLSNGGDLTFDPASDKKSIICPLRKECCLSADPPEAQDTMHSAMKGGTMMPRPRTGLRASSSAFIF